MTMGRQSLHFRPASLHDTRNLLTSSFHFSRNVNLFGPPGSSSQGTCSLHVPVAQVHQEGQSVSVKPAGLCPPGILKAAADHGQQPASSRPLHARSGGAEGGGVRHGPPAGASRTMIKPVMRSQDFTLKWARHDADPAADSGGHHDARAPWIAQDGSLVRYL